MMKLNPRIQHELTMKFAELYHKGSTYIPTFMLLQWFQKDGGKITQAFFKREIFNRWYEYLDVEDAEEIFPLSVLNVLSDHSVKKPEGYILFQNTFLYIPPQSLEEEEEEEEEEE
ncbi:hypothetical protein [Pectobacterium versatile]|uniref:hypothetical protein n=1 Tax=Pectobacterium versatile TaxID=2488639 RepID=UPI003017F5B1